MDNEIKDKIIEILNDNGINLKDDGTFEEFSSIEYVSTMVSIENEFNIEIPDEFLIADNIPNIESLTSVVENEIAKD